MKLLRNVFRIALILGLGLCNVRGADSTVDIESQEYRVSLLGEEEQWVEYQNRSKYLFKVHNKLTQQDSTIEMMNLTTHVDDMKVYKDRLVIFGDVDPARAHGVTVIDLKRNQEIDFILCYWPRLSVTNRYVVYKKFYPRLASEEVRSDLILVYDLEKSLEDNRIEKNYKNLRKRNKRISDREYIEASENVGYPIYPEENISKQTYFVWVPSLNERHLVLTMGQYLWLDRDSKVAFVDRSGGENWLVLVGLSQGLDKVEIRKRIIDIASVLAIDPSSPDYEASLKEAKERFVPDELRWTKDGKIVISLKPTARYKTTEIEMDMP